MDLPDLWCAAVVACTVVACTPKGGDPTQAKSEAQPQRPTPSPPVVETTPQETPAPAAEPIIGWERPPSISAAARRDNRKGLKHHRAGEYEQSKELFAAAVAASPEHDYAAYNYACARARLGELSQAADALLPLLHRDPARFAHLIETDADLETLRSSPEYAALAEALPVVHAQWEVVHDNGVPAMMYEYEPRKLEFGPEDSYEPEFVGGVERLVVGAYVPKTRRFVPLGRGGNVALIDLPRRQWLRADIDHYVTPADNYPNLSIGGVALHGTFPSDELIARGPLYECAEDDMCSTSAAVLVVEDHAFTAKTDWVSWETDGGPTYVRIDGGGSHPAAKALPEGPRLVVVQGGGYLDLGVPAPWSCSRGRLSAGPDQPPLELSGVHAKADATSVVVAADGQTLVVTSVRWHDRSKDFDDPVHAIHRVDLATNTITELGAGEGTGHTVLGPDDAFYVQSGFDTRRWEPAGERGEPLPEGVYLTTPLEPYDCGPCG